MKRRSFLKSAAIAGAAAGLPLALQAKAAPRWRVLRADDARAGTAYAAIAAAACEAPTLRVRMDGLHRRSDSSLRELTLTAQFDSGRGRAGYVAWQHASGRDTQRSRFVADRTAMRGFTLRTRHEGEAACHAQECALTALDVPLLSPGHYVIVPAQAAGPFAHSGDATRPLGAAPFDYLAFRVEAA